MIGDAGRQKRSQSGVRAAVEADAPDERLFIASLEKGLKVLESFADMTAEQGMQEIAVVTGLGKSAVQRLVYTLSYLGYLRRDPSTKKYRLSSKAFLRGYALARASDLVQEAYGQLTRMNNISGETCVLATLEDGEVVILSSVRGRHIDSLNVDVGMRFPAHASSSGLALLAWLSKEDARRSLAKSLQTGCEGTAVSMLESLADELVLIRDQGYCITEDKIAAGHLSISVPVFDASGHAVACLNVSTLKHRYGDPDTRRGLIDLVIGAAGKVSLRLGHLANSGASSRNADT